MPYLQKLAVANNLAPAPSAVPALPGTCPSSLMRPPVEEQSA
jgi:hypothetical protein